MIAEALFVVGAALAWLRVVSGLVGFTLFALGGILGLVVGVVTVIQAARGRGLGSGGGARRRAVGVMVAAIFAVEPWMFQLVYPSIDGEQSAQGIARAAAARVPPGGSVGALSCGPLAAALRYYGGKPVELIESADSMRSFLACKFSLSMCHGLAGVLVENAPSAS